MATFQQSDYIKQAEKWVRQRNGGQISFDEQQQVREDAQDHIGNLMPEWNSWDEARQVEELGKLDKRHLSAAMTSCVDGGNWLPFVLPSALNIEFLKRLQEPLTADEMKASMEGYRRMRAAKGLPCDRDEAGLRKRIEFNYNETVESIIMAVDRYDGMSLLEKTAVENKENGAKMNMLLHRARQVTHVKKRSKTSKKGGFVARLKNNETKKTAAQPRRKRGNDGR